MITEKEDIYYELLILRCKRGETAALEELIHNWERRLFYYVRRLVDNEQDAWDILQEMWLKVIGGIKLLREPRSLPAWLYRIARNTAMSHFRSQNKTSVSLNDNKNTSYVEENNEHFHFENAEQVHYGLTQISLPHREVLTLYFLQDLSLEEIAEVLEIPLGTIKSRLYYAKSALRTVLEEEGRNE
ncbi:RNA polymerase sigma factor [bacterium]|nr:RNA polymerase sigma factor [bacterium]